MTLFPKLGAANPALYGISDTPASKDAIKIASFLRLSGTGMTSLISSAELSDDCVSRFTSLVRARD